MDLLGYPILPHRLCLSPFREYILMFPLVITRIEERIPSNSACAYKFPELVTQRYIRCQVWSNKSQFVYKQLINRGYEQMLIKLEVGYEIIKTHLCILKIGVEWYALRINSSLNYLIHHHLLSIGLIIYSDLNKV